MRVIVADASNIIRERMRLLLERAGIEMVGEASDAATALDLTKKNQPDVVILDLMLPAVSDFKSGLIPFDTIRDLKRVSPYSRVIVLTQGLPAPYRKMYTDAGADFVLDKVFEFDRIKQVLGQGKGKLMLLLPI